MADGFNAVGISQGGLLLRLLVVITVQEFNSFSLTISQEDYQFLDFQYLDDKTNEISNCY